VVQGQFRLVGGLGQAMLLLLLLMLMSQVKQ
jgi:hypothetical protein